jgi:murein hydrolase activator
MIFIKGLEFSGNVGEKVRPVAKGKVVFSQLLPGLGNVVIVDHGKRYYTLYGRLSSVLTQLGDIVGRGDTVGILGEPDRKGRNFYFELRQKGKAMNPQPFFSEKLPVFRASENEDV